MKKKYPIHDCDICFKENEEIFGDCCGVKACIECDSKLHGLCSVCEKDESQPTAVTFESRAPFQGEVHFQIISQD